MEGLKITEIDNLNLEESALLKMVSQIRRSFGITVKDLRMYYNKFPVILQSILFPVILLFSFTVGRNVEVVYIVSGIMALVLFYSATAIAPITFPWETLLKTLERTMTTPITIKTILLGDIWASFLYGTLISLVPLFLGIIAFSLWTSLNILVLILGIIVASFSFSCFSILMSVPPFSHPSSTMIMSITIKFPIVMISPIFVAINIWPTSIISPITYFIDIVNSGLSGTSTFGPFGLLLDFGVLMLFGLGILALSFKLHEKTLQKRYRT
ncbi:MAG: ABC transporter permease [Candidatus Lokiarchaeota archaeon]|nr:ABC transporter permease [Candidatus Lokiarchaeota archaeon]